MRSTFEAVIAIGAACFLLPAIPLASATSPGTDEAGQQPYQGNTVPGDEGKGALPCAHARIQAESLPGLRAAASAADDGETDVLNYHLDIEILPEYEGGVVTAVAVRGTSTIDTRAKLDGLSRFVVDLKGNMLVENVSGDIASWTRNEGEDALAIQLDRLYAAGEVFSISVTYSGYPESDGYGAFLWWMREDDLIVATLSQPFYARNWWPCKDALDDKATMEMHITVPEGMVAVSNGLELGAERLWDGRIRWGWAENYPMIPYLASIAAGPYQRYDLEFYTGPESDTTMPVSCYLYPDHWDFDAGTPYAEYQAGCDEMTQMLDTFSSLYGPYPFLEEKYGVVETGGAGGLAASMEHQTISSMTQVAWYSDIMAHELAHQWWGDEVTCQTWEDIWLNEGFASYSEALYREFGSGNDTDAYWDRMNERNPADPDAQVYRTTADTVNDIFSLNDVYNKGAWVLHMLRHVMGDESFFKALEDYRETYRHDSVTTEEFTRAFSESYGQDLSWFVDEWVMRPGSPDYVWRYETRRASGRTWLIVSISQVQDTRGYGLFTMPIDLYIETEQGSQTVRLWNDAWRSRYAIPLDGQPLFVALDQDQGIADHNWILGRTVTWSNAPLGTPPDLDAYLSIAPPGTNDGTHGLPPGTVTGVHAASGSVVRLE